MLLLYNIPTQTHIHRDKPAVEGHGQRQEEGRDPDHQHDDVQRPLLPQLLRQEGPHDSQPAVQAHHTDHINRYVHVDAAEVVHELTHAVSELPAVRSSQQAQEKGGAQEHQSICHREIQDQEARNGAPLDTAEHCPHHEEIPGKTEDEGDDQDSYPSPMGLRGGVGGG